MKIEITVLNTTITPFYPKKTRIGENMSQKLYKYSNEYIESEGKCENYARPTAAAVRPPLLTEARLFLAFQTLSALLTGSFAGDIAVGRLLV